MTRVSDHDSSAPASAISAALHQALQTSGGLWEWLPIGIYVCDAEGYVIQYNPRAAELWGHSPPLVDGRTRFCGALRIYKPNGEPIPLTEIPMAEVLKTGQPVRDREVVLERPDGTKLTVLVNINPLFDEHGVLVGAVNCFQDISARTLAEEQLRERERWYRNLLEALPAAIYTTDAEGRITFFNEAAAQLAGRRSKLGGDAWSVASKLYWPDGRPISYAECPTAVVLKTGAPLRGTEKVIERPDGTRVPVLPYPTPLHDDEGRLTGAVNMLVDITERKRAEEEKMRLLRELAHRVNNTFAVILAITQQSLRAAPSPAAFAETFTGRLQALACAHNLLLAQNWTGADLGELAKGQLAPFVFNGSNRLKVEGPQVTLDPTQAIALGVVLHELGTNAVKYGAFSNGSGKVELRWNLGNERVSLAWVERGGPPVVPPLRKGLGSKLIERGLPNAVIEWCFPPEGVKCAIELPLLARKTANDAAPRA